MLNGAFSFEGLIWNGLQSLKKPGSIDTLSVEEVTALIEALSDELQVRLRMISKVRSKGVWEADDLLQEAIVRTVSGERKCPRDLPIEVFLSGVMRSLVSSSAKETSRKPETVSLDVEGSSDLHESLAVAEQDTPEKHMINANQARVLQNRILDALSDDETNQILALGMMDEQKGAELQKLAGINENELATRRRQIRRRLNAEFGKED